MAAFASAALAVSPAAAQTTTSSSPPPTSTQQVDPNANSSSGTIYEIPLQAGRQDAAPRRRHRKHGGGGSSSSGGPRNGTLVKSDNGYSSSSHVPGTAAKPAARHPHKRRALLRAGRHKGRGRHLLRRLFGGGGGARAQAAKGPGSGAPPAVPAALTQPQPSNVGTFLLVALVIAVAIGGGVLTSRARRRGRPSG